MSELRRAAVAMVAIALAAAALVPSRPAAALSVAAENAPAVVHVDCAVSENGDGSRRAPFHRVTDAVSAARALHAADRVTVAVRSGTCGAETLPLVLDFPVWIRGAGDGEVDGEGLPTGSRAHDTTINILPPATFFVVTGDDVRISGLSIDGQVANPVPPAAGTIAIDVNGAQGFELRDLRIVRVIQGVRTTSASGSISSTYFGTVSAGAVFQGGDVESPANVRFTHNRVENYAIGAVALAGAGATGTTVSATITDNDLVTARVNTGPSNPFGIRIAPILQGTPATGGEVTATIARNQIRGTHRYGIVINGGQVFRTNRLVPDERLFTGALDLTFRHNAIDAGPTARAGSLITFTNSRATELPCELDPANTPATCPSVMNGQYWKYLQDADFAIRHTGELDGYLLDHPVQDPVDGRTLSNVVTINREIIAHATFVELP